MFLPYTSTTHGQGVDSKRGGGRVVLPFHTPWTCRRKPWGAKRNRLVQLG